MQGGRGRGRARSLQQEDKDEGSAVTAGGLDRREELFEACQDDAAEQAAADAVLMAVTTAGTQIGVRAHSD